MKAFILATTFLISSCLIDRSVVAQRIGTSAIYPFRAGNRDDSLDVVLQRVNALIETRAFYEKTYLQKELVYLPVKSSFAVFPATKPYATLGNLPKGASKKHFKRYYCQAHASLKTAIDAQNREINKENDSFKEAQKRANIGLQRSQLRLKRIEDYELLFVSDQFFVKTSPTDPRENKLLDSLTLYLDQILLGHPTNLDGYVNSINYVSPNLDQDSVPELIEKLLIENLNVCKGLVTSKAFMARLEGVKINHTKLRGQNKLWAYTNIPNKTIYLSPYLIRAIYNITLYKGKLFRLAELNRDRPGGIRSFLQGKSGSSVSQIDTAYFSNFVDLFSKNIAFIIGHELAHIYLSTKELDIDIERACDLYAAYYFLKQSGDLNLGAFENFLAKSVSGNELVFWGERISKDQLTARYDELVKIKSANNINLIIDRIHPDTN